MGKLDDARAAMACHYEAGRAVALWWGGIGPQPVDMPWNDAIPEPSRADAAVSMQDAFDRFLAQESSEPLPSGGTLLDWTWRDWERMEVAMLTCYAGSVAWARHRRRAVESCLVGDGKADVQRAEAILKTHISRANLIGRSADFWRQTALTNAVRLVRSRQGWAAVSSIADRLWHRGFVSAVEVEDLCSEAFGPGWDPHWPPCRGALDDGQMAQAYWQKRRDVAGRPRSTVPDPHPAHSSAR